jgi:preprotein translocase subunit SecG
VSNFFIVKKSISFTVTCKSNSRKEWVLMGSTWYSLARSTWQAARWIWTAIIIVIIVGVTTTLFAGTSAGAASSFVFKIFEWFNTRGFYQYLTLSLIGLFILVTLASGIITFALRKKYEPAYTPPPEIQAILDYIEKDVETTKKKDEVQQARDR